MFHFGFSYVGLIYLLMLFIPNIIWSKHKPKDYEQYAQKENKFLVAVYSVECRLVNAYIPFGDAFAPRKT